MARVRDVFPGDMVSAVGWDVALSSGNRVAELPIGWLIPHGMNHKAAVEMGHKITLFYIGPVRIQVRDAYRKMHHFLTEEGGSVCLEGHEFRHLSVCTF